MEPIVLFGIQFTLSLVAYALIGFWYVAPRLSRLPREVAVVPLAVGACVSHCRRDDPGSWRFRCRRANGFPDDDRLWRHGNGLAGPAGIDRAPCPVLWCDCIGLAVRHCWDAGHRECDYSIDTRQCVHLCAWRKLGDCDYVRAGVAGEQPSDFHAIAQSQSRP